MPPARRRLMSLSVSLVPLAWLALAATATGRAAPAPAPTTAPAEAVSPEEVDRIIAAVSHEDAETRRFAQVLVKNLPAEAYEIVRTRFNPEELDPETRVTLGRSMNVLRVRYLKHRQMIEELEWQERQAVEAYEKNGPHDPKWDAAARAALARLGERRHREDLTELEDVVAAFRRAVDAGCTHPVVVMLYNNQRLAHQWNVAAAQGQPRPVPDSTGLPAMRAAAEAMRQGSYPARLKCTAYHAVAQMLSGKAGGRDEAKRWLNAALDLLPEALATPGYPVERQKGLVINQYETEVLLDPRGGRWASFKRLYPLYSAAAAPDAPGPLIFKGEAYLAWAWDTRAKERGEAAEAEARRLRKERFAAAEEALEAAWQLDPANWRVPALMIKVKTGQREDRESMEKWFRRAMESDPDNAAACLGKIFYLAPRWGGDREAMREFGRECLATENYRGRVAFVLAQAHRHLANESPDPEGYLRRPGVWEDVQATYEGALKVFPDSIHDRSVYAGLAYGAGQYAKAQEQFEVLGENADLAFWGGRDGYDYQRLETARRLHAAARGEPVRPAPAVEEAFAKALEDAYDNHNLEALQKVAHRFPEVPVGTERGKAQWHQVTLNAASKGIDCVRFRTPKGKPLDMRWVSVMARDRLTWWYMLRVDGRPMRGFSEYNPYPAKDLPNVKVPGDGGEHDVKVQQLPADRLEPDTEYLLWFRFRGVGPVRTTIAITFVPPAKAQIDWRALLKDLGLRWAGDK